VLDLEQNIDKLHTTEMGIKRISKNIEIKSEDVVSWCKEAVKSADRRMLSGKNWYCYKNGVCITVNAHSLTIITAHKIKGGRPDREDCLTVKEL